MPDHTRASRDSEPPAGVLVDFHGTLAQVEDPITWVRAAAADCGVVLDVLRATALADRYLTAGRPGGPPPARIPPPLAEVYADRDLDEYAHRAAYVGLAAAVNCGIDGMAEALYERIRQPGGWVAYPDAAPTLATLARAGLPVALVSNIGFDLRPVTEALGLAEHLTAHVLSYEVGRVKPDPAIFMQACTAIGVPPEKVLMVGNSPDDAGAVDLGARAYLVPTLPAGEANDLPAVLRLAGLP